MRLFPIVILLFVWHTLDSQVIHWRGENGDGKFNESSLLEKWPEEGPDSLLFVEGIGKGWSSAIASGESIFVTGMKDSMDYLSSIDLNGKIRWQVPYGLSWIKSFPDTRGTPTIEEDRVYVISGMGRLVCLSADSGKELWAVNVDSLFEGEWHRWGVSETPLIYENKVFCSPGGNETTLVALDKMTGELIWKSESIGGPRSYVSPVLYEYGDHRFVLAMTATTLGAFDPEDGSTRWTYRYYNSEWWKRDALNLTNSPVFIGDEIFLSKGYDYPAVMLKMDDLGTSVSEKWFNRTLDNHHHGLVVHEGYIYGSNWLNNRKGNWVCLDWETGELKYEIEWFNKGAMIFADGMLYCYEEKSGNVALVKPNPEKFEVISSFKMEGGSGPHWAHPWINDGKLYLRHGDVLRVYDIGARSPE